MLNVIKKNIINRIINMLKSLPQKPSNNIFILYTILTDIKSIVYTHILTQPHKFQLTVVSCQTNSSPDVANYLIQEITCSLFF